METLLKAKEDLDAKRYDSSIAVCQIFYILLFILTPIYLIVFLVKGPSWTAIHVVPKLTGSSGFLLFGVAPVCAVLAISRSLRSTCATSMLLMSAWLTFSLWCWSVTTSFFYAGTVLTVIGFLMAGMGVYVVALGATAWDKDWLVFGALVGGAIAIALLRILGIFFLSRIREAETSSLRKLLRWPGLILAIGLAESFYNLLYRLPYGQELEEFTAAATSAGLGCAFLGFIVAAIARRKPFFKFASQVAFTTWLVLHVISIARTVV
jgi:hypothetical protein